MNRSVLIVLALLPLPVWSQERHSSYERVCVPVASDVDCARGSGNGPKIPSRSGRGGRT